MKKIALLFLLAVMFTGCFNDSLEYFGEKANVPATRVYVQGQLISGPMTKAAYSWMSEGNGEAVARYSLRADNTAPDYLDHPSDLYYGRPSGKEEGAHNLGKIYTNYPYGHYNDRNFDYYKVDKATGNNIGLFRYIFDKKGLQTQYVLKEVPKVEDILADEVGDITAMINAGKVKDSQGRNLQEKLDDVNSILAKGTDYLNSHVLWYVVKEVGTQYGWHVNGIIADEPTGKPDHTPDNVEIDIHQQEHADWSEIKTSIHVRSDAGSLELNIPLAESDLVEAEAFNVRIYKDYVPGPTYVESAPVPAVITIKHDEKGITIIIDDINYDMIQGYKEQFGDGLTVEISSFCTFGNPEEIWNKLKESVVISTGKPVTVTGQITSALVEGSYVPIRVMNPVRVI